MKRVLAILVAISAIFTTSAGAVHVGDKISEAVYSDLAVYINHHPIPSYVVNDYAVIVAEDLQDYCCDVVWNGEDKTLNITRSAEKNTFTALPVYQCTMPGGSRYADVLYTDIKTYVNGKEVTSFNIDGRTMIVIDEFGAAMDGYTWDNNTRAAKAWIDGKPYCDFAPLMARTEMVYQTSYDYNGQSLMHYVGWADFNFDGEKETIEVKASYPTSNWYESQYLEVTIGDKKSKIEVYDAELSAIYVCDVDRSDGVKDLVVVTVEGSGDPVLRLYQYTNGLPMYKFGYYNTWDNQYFILDDGIGLGYVDAASFHVNDDDSITMKTQTKSAGMWYVNRKYVKDDYGTFMEVREEVYDVLPDFMESRTYFDEMSAEEINMWEKGYIKAHCKYVSNGFTIQKGEYFKVLRDNDYNFIYVVKQNGAAGWISIDYDMQRGELNPHFFFLAG